MKSTTNKTSGCWIAALLALGAAQAAAQVPCEALNLDFGRKDAGWAHQPLSKLKRDTVYTLAKQEGSTVLRAAANGSASLYAAPAKISGVPTVLSWRWKTAALVAGADNRNKSREDAPLRVILSFDGDHAGLSKEEQRRFRRARSLTGRDIPYATLMYIWSDGVAPESVIPSAHTSQVKMLAVASGSKGLGQWQSVKRNVAEDFRRAYGAAPGKLLGVAVMTDADNTGSKALGEYADIRLECAAQ